MVSATLGPMCGLMEISLLSVLPVIAGYCVFSNLEPMPYFTYSLVDSLRQISVGQLTGLRDHSAGL